MLKRSYLLALMSAPLLLSACGEGYEMIRTDAFPYGNQRTAGTGVAYVLAKMMPEKKLNLEPANQEVMQPVVREREVEAVSNDEAIQDLREMFAKEQRK